MGAGNDGTGGGENTSRAERERMGVYAIIFFIIFTFLSALLYREYQKDYH